MALPALIRPRPRQHGVLAGASAGYLGHLGPGRPRASSSLLVSSPWSPGPSSSTRASPCAAPTPSPETFLEVFRKSNKFSEVNSVCVQLKASPLVGVFQAGYQEVNQQVRGGRGQPGDARRPRPTVRSLESLSRALARAATVESTRLERRVTLPRHHGQRDAVHRPVRHGVGHHERVRRHRPHGLGEPGRGRARHLGGAHHHRHGPAPPPSPPPSSTTSTAAASRCCSSMMDDFALEFLNIVERNFT